MHWSVQNDALLHWNFFIANKGENVVGRDEKNILSQPIFASCEGGIDNQFYDEKEVKYLPYSDVI